MYIIFYRFWVSLWCFFTLILEIIGYTLYRGNTWQVGFGLMILPIALLGCIMWLLCALWTMNKKLIIICFLILLIGFPFLKRTISFSFLSKSNANSSVSILSYNVMFFDYYGFMGKQNSNNAPRLINWVVDKNVDVKCFQEFYDGKGIFNVSERLKDKGYPYFTMANSYYPNFKGQAIFSRFPLIKRQSKVYNNEGNGYLVADMVYHKDTLRIINVHLHSMGIRINNILKTTDYEAAKVASKHVFTLLKKGFIIRAKQVDDITRLIKKSPYPVVLCGDLNETPFGYAYSSIRHYLNNSFEEGGSGFGFGFTYNRSPKYIRIDNHFFDSSTLVLKSFIQPSVKYSDHYPIICKYQLKKNR
jgi:exonuclease III